MAGSSKVSLKSILVSAAFGVVLAVAYGLVTHRSHAKPDRSAKSSTASSPAESAMRARNLALGRLLGTKPAPSHPAFPGLALGDTTEQQGIAWAKARKLDCVRKYKGLHFLICSAVPPVALGEDDSSPEVKDLTLTFGPKGKLVGAEALRLGVSEAEAEKLFTHTTDGLKHALGAPTAHVGTTGTGELKHAMHSVSARWAFRDYLATVRATQLPTGIAFREEYQAATIRPGH